MTAPAAALLALDRVKEQFEADGYTFRLQERLPPPFQAFVADAVARRNDELVIIEARSANMNDQTRNRLGRLAEIMATESGWRLDIVTYEPEVQPRSPTREDIVRRLEEAHQVADLSPDASVMLTWAAIEAALYLASERQGLAPTRTLPPRALIRNLNIDGVISDNQATELDTFARLRDEIAHGMTSEPPDLDHIEWLRRFALAAADNNLATVEDMVEWFCNHYTTPEDANPVNDKEARNHAGLGSSSHNPSDVLRAQFEVALDADIAEAIEVLERDDIKRAQRDRYPLH